MFMLLAIPVGIVAGLLAGGSVDRLATFRFRWGALAVAGLVAQVALFSPSINEAAGSLAPTLYVASTAAVLLAVVANLRIRGMPMVALGALSNLAAIVANGGYMPADAGALTAAGLDGPGEHTNSVVVAEPALRPLTDIFAIPSWVPLANVFSVGDVLIGIGIVIVIAATMQARSPGSHADAAERASALDGA